MMTDIQQAFGTLRTMLNHGMDTHLKRRALIDLLAPIQKAHPEQYQAEWRPYLKNASASWPVPFESVKSIERLKFLTNLLPDVRLTLYDPKAASVDEIIEILHSDHAKSIHTLTPYRWNSEAVFEAVLNTTSLVNLRVLNLSAIDDDRFERLWQSDNLSQVENFGMHGAQITDAAFRRFAFSERARTLTGFGVGASTLTRDSIDALVDSPTFDHIVSANLAGIKLYEDGTRYAAKGGIFDGAKYLQLTHCELGDQGILALGEHAQHIEKLDVVANHITPDGLSAFLQTRLATQVQHLTLSSNDELDGHYGRCFAQAPKLTQLKGLNIHDKLDDRIGDCWANIEAFNTIEQLAIWSAEINDEQMLKLINAPWMKGIKELEIGFNPLSEETIIAIINHPHMSQLQRFYANSLPLGQATAMALANSPYMSNLELFWYDKQKFTEEGRQAIQSSTHLSPYLRFNL